MTVRDDVSVLYAESPRVVRVAAPSTEISIQDLHDTLRDIEDEPEGIQYPDLIDSAGKESLGVGVQVGITSTLLNARVSFEARRASQSQGTVTGADADGIFLNDTSATFVADGVAPGSWIVDLTTGAICSVLRVLSETQLYTDGLGDGAGGDDAFGLGDSYKVWPVIQCEVSGGNLVAVDAAQAEIDAVLPTAGTQVVRSNSSSATLVTTEVPVVIGDGLTVSGIG